MATALQGRQAVEAVQTLLRLGDARFDRRRLDAALRSRHGRGLILVGLRNGRAVVRLSTLAARFRGRMPRPGVRRPLRALRARPAATAEPPRSSGGR